MSNAYQHSSTIPTDVTAARAALVEQDCARWGESERDASIRVHSRLTYGLALNSLAARAELDRALEAKALRAAAKKALTRDDWDVLRRGG
jgi:hypothetical protein